MFRQDVSAIKTVLLRKKSSLCFCLIVFTFSVQLLDSFHLSLIDLKKKERKENTFLLPENIFSSKILRAGVK